MTPIESIARAMCEHVGISPDRRYVRRGEHGSEHVRLAWQDYEPLATIAWRTALSLLREPSGEMLKAADDAWYQKLASTKGRPCDELYAAIWQAMIDAAAGVTDEGRTG